MRCAAIAAVLATLTCTSAAEGRLFYQTYGATVAAADGGCVWNANQDYFVPRTCDSGRYDLFSSCKTSHTTSPACRRGHQNYHGYCSPYGAWHYRYRDHVYKVHCGCTKLACYHGPWRREYAGCCRPPLQRLRQGCGTCTTQQACSVSVDSAVCGFEGWIDGAATATLEPFGIEVLGTIRVDGAGAVSGATKPAVAAASALEGDEESWLPSLGLPPQQESITAPVTRTTEPIL